VVAAKDGFEVVLDLEADAEADAVAAKDEPAKADADKDPPPVNDKGVEAVISPTLPALVGIIGTGIVAVNVPGVDDNVAFDTTGPFVAAAVARAPGGGGGLDESINNLVAVASMLARAPGSSVFVIVVSAAVAKFYNSINC
jgi:hypothetical protein